MPFSSPLQNQSDGPHTKMDSVFFLPDTRCTATNLIYTLAIVARNVIQSFMGYLSGDLETNVVVFCCWDDDARTKLSTRHCLLFR